MEQKYILQLTVDWIISVPNKRDSSTDTLLLKSSLLNNVEDDLENIDNAEITDCTDSTITGKLTVTKEHVIENPTKSPSEHVLDFINTAYFQDPPSSFETYEIRDIKVIEERKEIILEKTSLTELQEN